MSNHSTPKTSASGQYASFKSMFKAADHDVLAEVADRLYMSIRQQTDEQIRITQALFEAASANKQVMQVVLPFLKMLQTGNRLGIEMDQLVEERIEKGSARGKSA